MINLILGIFHIPDIPDFDVMSDGGGGGKQILVMLGEFNVSDLPLVNFLFGDHVE